MVTPQSEFDGSTGVRESKTWVLTGRPGLAFRISVL